ncbi:MAG: hypothetical protein DI536_36360 [Archangium gephyra]|uniref:FecR protein domain-containing protein n=1 Tax=Archangium gephyra TaxID=48 RepID=A0A2W5U341_9BACT|nr:MAG: hypothetical protein DI536_36360 [Archangium gephyra]
MTLLRKSHPPETPDEAAIWWASQRLLDPVRFAENEEFSHWLAHEANAHAWQELDRRVELTDAFAAMPEIREMRRAALALARDRSRLSRGKWIVGGALAASLAAALVWIGQPDAGPGPADVAAADHVRRYSAAIGQRRDVVLEDGSRVTLDTGSQIAVLFTDARREIALLAGRARFDVAKNAERPFIVSAGSRLVTAIGTAFEVRLRTDGNVQVLLVEGHVRVDPTRPAGLARVIPALARTDLEPGDLLTEAAGNVAVERGDVARETAWSRGMLIFRNDSVAEAISEVNRYSTVQLVVEDPRVAQLKVSGIFSTTSGEEFVAALEALYPVRARAAAGGTIRLDWRDDTPGREN